MGFDLDRNEKVSQILEKFRDFWIEVKPSFLSKSDLLRISQAIAKFVKKSNFRIILAGFSSNLKGILEKETKIDSGFKEDIYRRGQR
jgi:Leu/Phe-tRNA-protein transferase